MGSEVAECEVADCHAPTASESSLHCLGHVKDEQIGPLVRNMRRTHGAIDVRRGRFEATRVSRILAEASGTSQVLRVPIAFGGARISGDLTLTGFRLTARLDFAGARIDAVRIGQIEGLQHLRLGAPAWERTRIGAFIVSDCDAPMEELALAEIDVDDRVHIRRSGLRYLGLDRCRLGNTCTFSDVSIGASLEIVRCSAGSMSMDNVRVEDGVTIGMLYGEQVDLRSCRFATWVDLTSTGSLVSDRCLFGGPTNLQWVSPSIVAQALASDGPRRGVSVSEVTPPAETSTDTSLRSARFGSTAHLRLAGGKVMLPGCVFSDASTLRPAETATRRPRLVNVSEMDGDELGIGSIDVSSCKLADAASLGPIDPAGLDLGFGAAGLTHRHHLADEGTRRDYRLLTRRKTPRGRAQRTKAQSLAKTYRDLRRSNEDVGNHAGSNDLYYGERLWERKASRVLSVDWLWLAAYGLVGYGVRPLRPFLWLIAVVTAGVLAFGAADGLYHERLVTGAPDDRVAILCSNDRRESTPHRTQRILCPADLGERVEFAVRTTTTIIRPIGGFETRGIGITLDIAIRLLSALLFALLVLAIRNRVRR
jgi:hypothetical protein